MTKWVKNKPTIKRRPSSATVTSSLHRFESNNSSTAPSMKIINFMLTTLIIAALAHTTNGFRSIELNSGEGRKLFGGYRITPKHCRATRTLPMSDPRANGPTICMFNHECAQRNGEVVGACMDGFLFGACCQLANAQNTESSLIKDAQNAYFQNHKLQMQQAAAAAAATSRPTITTAQAFETYGTSLQESIEEENQSGNNNNKGYQQLESTSNSQSPSHSQQQQSQEQQYISSSSSNYPSTQVTSGTMTYGDSQQSQQTLNDETVEHTDTSTSAQQQQTEIYGSSTPNEQEQQQSSSTELESDSNLQVDSEVGNTNAVSQTQPPPFKVHKHSVKITSPSIPTHNDDFVMQVLSTLPPGHDNDHVTFTTEVPMKISSNMADQISSESSSFEEPVGTQIPMRVEDKPVKDNASQQQPTTLPPHIFSDEPVEKTKQPTSATKRPQQQHKKPQQQHKKPQQQQQKQQQKKPQQQQKRPQQQQQQQHQHQQQQYLQEQQYQHNHRPPQDQQKLQQQQSDNSHHHNHLVLDGGIFTHSDITHPGADADLLEEDLQFSTGYGPQPVYVKTPSKEPADYSHSTTIKSTSLDGQYSSQNKPATTTTNSVITTHADSIESIILQLNNTNLGPSYNVVSQETPSYSSELSTSHADSPIDRYDVQSTHYESTPRPPPSTSPYYQENETKRPEDYYSPTEQQQQGYPSAQPQVPAYLETVTTNLNTPVPISYDLVTDDKSVETQPLLEQTSYPVTHATGSVSSPTGTYSEDLSEVLDEHTMPEKNYLDVGSSGHPTHEFNRMPAMGIAYPVDMSYIDEEEPSSYASQSHLSTTTQRPYHASSTSSIHQQLTTQIDNFNAPPHTRLPDDNNNAQRPIASYIGVVTSQNYNQQPQLSVYGKLPEEVSVTQTTQVQPDYETPAYQSTQTEKLTTVSFAESSTPSPRPSSARPTTFSYASTTSTPLITRPQYSSSSTLSTTYRPTLVTAGPRPSSQPSKRPSKRPGSNTNNKKTTKPQNTKRPSQTTSAYNPANNYSQNSPNTKRPKPTPTPGYSSTRPISSKKPTKQPSTVYTLEPIYSKRPTATSKPLPTASPSTQPQQTYTQSGQIKNPVNYGAAQQENSYTQTTNIIRRPVGPPADSYNRPPSPTKKRRPVTQPANIYQTENNNKQTIPTYGDDNKAPTQNTFTYNQDQQNNNRQPIPSYGDDTKTPTQNTYTYNQDQQNNNRQPIPSYGDENKSPEQPLFEYNEDQQNNNRQPMPSYGDENKSPEQSLFTGNQDQQNNNRQPIPSYDDENKAPAQPTFTYNHDQHNNNRQPIPNYEDEKKNPVQPSLVYNQDQHVASSPTKRPSSGQPKPASNKPISTSYVTGPTTPRPPTTYVYHDNEVPPLVIADDKLDSFVHNNAETIAAESSAISYTSPGYASSLSPTLKPQNAHNNNYKKPGFVKVQPTIRPPAPTVLITPKPTTLNLVTASSWAQRPNSGSYLPVDPAYPSTTPMPAFGSTSYIYNQVVTRRPDFSENTPEYISIAPVTSNDFDDPGYYGAQSSVHPAFTQASTEATYAVPSDDRPAFPGYYGPTPTYPTFAVPGEKFDSPVEEETHTSPNDFVNFPPVRNPNLNMSAVSSAVTSDLELSTPSFVEDAILKDKMNTLVHKIVESLQGNFDALSEIIDEPVPGSTYQAGTVTAGTTPPARRTTRKPATTTKPKTTTKKPVSRVTTKRPTVTTRKPATRRTTTRKPTSKPTRKAASTTQSAPIEDEVVDEEDEEDVNPSANEVDQDDTVGSGAGGRKFQCGVRPHVKSGRIVGGKGTTFGAYPWQVLVRESTWLGLFTKNKCGGVLITNRYVITAAHCQPGFLASLVAVFGEFDISGDVESKRPVTKNVKRVIVHRQYDPATFENDLALLELDSPVQFDSHIVPICMPQDRADFTGRMATVTGWGRLKYGGGVPSVLQEVQVPIIENSVCQEMFHTAGHNKKILSSFLCAGYANGQKDSCEGDSGGPLVLQRPDGRYELAGTVSHGIKCAAPYLPGVYMRTTYYKPWLRSITGVK